MSTLKRGRLEVDEYHDEGRSEHPLVRRRVQLEDEQQKECRRIGFPSGPPTQPPTLQYPYQILTFSYTPERVLEFGDVAMRYYSDPPIGAELSYAYDKWIRRPEERGRLDGLLSACAKDEVKLDRTKANVISWRGVMTKILTAPYEDRDDGWEMNVMFLDGTLYFEEHLDDAKLKEKENMTARQRQLSYYGYAFESYSTSATPDPSDDPEKQKNGWSGNINTNVQWCSVVKTKLGNIRLIVGGEVDCVEGRYTGQPDTFVELKTSQSIKSSQDEGRFEKKLLKFYFQSFLLGVPKIVVGFRTHSGRLSLVQKFETIHIPRLVRGKQGGWNPNRCLTWAVNFVSFLKSTVVQWDEHFPGGSNDCPEKRVWRVNFIKGKGAEITLLDEPGVGEVRNGEDRIGFLPRWYWDVVKGQSRRAQDNENTAKVGTT